MVASETVRRRGYQNTVYLTYFTVHTARNMSARVDFDADARSSFRRMDTNGDGKLSISELKAALEELRVPTSREDVDQLYRDMDLNRDGSVSQEEFVAFAKRRRRVLRSAFDEICLMGGGIEAGAKLGEAVSFNAQQLRKSAEQSGVVLSDRDVRTIMRRLDENKDGSVSFDEFVECLLLVPHVNPHVFLDRWFVDDFSDDAQSDFTFPREVRLDDESTFAVVVQQKLVCGAAAGCLSRTLTAPFDRIRLLMMTSVKQMGIANAYSVAVSPPRGVVGLWTGNGVNCLKIGPEMAIKLVAFDLLKNSIAADPGNITPAERLFAGGTAGALAEFCIYPMDVLRTRLATAPTGTYSGIANCFWSVYRSGGTTALYAGLAPSIMGIIPYAAIDLSINSMLQDLAASRLMRKEKEVSVPLLLGCGMASSATATILTFPLNVVRTQAQATGAPFSHVVRSVKSEGILGFFRGLMPCLLKVMPATSISYAAYEWLNARWSTTLIR